MKLKNALRISIVCEWTFGLLSVFFSFLLEDSLPELLKQWVMQQAEADITNSEILIVVLGIPLVIGYFVASIGLFFLQKWAKWLYLASLILMIVLSPLLGPSVTNNLENIFDELSTTFAGIILALVFFTDVLNKKAEQEDFPNSATASQEI